MEDLATIAALALALVALLISTLRADPRAVADLRTRLLALESEVPALLDRVTRLVKRDAARAARDAKDSDSPTPPRLVGKDELRRRAGLL